MPFLCIFVITTKFNSNEQINFYFFNITIIYEYKQGSTAYNLS